MWRELVPGVVLAAACVVLGAAPAVAAQHDGPCADADRPIPDLTRSQSREALSCLLDAERGELGRGPLRADRPLERIAQGHASDQARRGYRGHVTPEGKTLADRVRNGARLKGWNRRWEVGEALAWGTGEFSTPREVIRMLLSSPSHRRIVLSARYRVSGVGVATYFPESGEAALPGAVVVFNVARLR